MPYEWTPPPAQASDERRLALWPYRSLLRRHFVIFIGATAALAALPLLAVLGTLVLWALLPFLLLTLWGIWFALSQSYKSGELLEELELGQNTARLTRHTPGKARQDWQANRYWITVQLYPTTGPVENYVTLRGGNREVEIGAFLDPEERLALYDELKTALR